MFSSFCFFVLLGLPLARADGWDDFSNNLATDLAPFLSLFGEKVTMQYLSESITLLDYFIFAMAPMGIITAIVSAIRVCGSPSLRAFIGRAQEGGGSAEAELCSSTSRDVCELYNNGGITRVFGRPKILEIVHDPVDPDFSKNAGLYTFREYVETKKGEGIWREEGTKSHGDQEAGGEMNQSQNAMADAESFAPNLSLNVGIKRKPQAIFWAVAIAGAILQAGVMVFASMVTYYLHWEIDGSSPEQYACPLAISGTLLVCGGVFCCAYLVGESTKERVFRRKPNNKNVHSEGANRSTRPSLFWVQPGDQVLGDQTFDPFCYSDHDEPLQEYLISWKNRSEKSERAVWATVGVTIIGFVLQFVGLRGIHATVSIAQLGAIMLMSAARASLRMQRLKPKDNFFADYPDEVVGYELDWLALYIGRVDIHSDFNTSPPSSLSSRSSPSPPQHPLVPGNSSRELRYFWKFCGVPENSIDRVKWSQSSLEGRIDNTATKLLAYRTRLADLTKSLNALPEQATSARNFRIEMVKVRLQAQKLAAGIVSAVNAIYSNTSWIREGETDEYLVWKINCTVSMEVPSNSLSEEPKDAPNLLKQHAIHLKLCRTAGSPWKLENPLELEAVLGLWVWSLVSDPTMQTEDPYSRLRRSRAAEVVAQRIVSTSQNLKHLSLWTGDTNSNFKKTTLCLKPSEFRRPASVFLLNQLESGQPNFIYEPLQSRLPKELGSHDNPMAVRLFGWHNIELSQIQDSESTLGLFEFYTSDISGGLLSSCAQDVFGSFVKSILDMTHNLDSIDIEEDRQGFRLGNTVVTEMVKSFTESELGSRREALLCVLPPMIARLQLPSAEVILQAARRRANENRTHKQWKGAESVLRWAWEICTASHNKGENAVEDHTSQAAIALGELYRWALMDENTTHFGINGINWLLGQKNKCQSEACHKVIDRYDAIQKGFVQKTNGTNNNNNNGTSSATEDDLIMTLLHLTRSNFMMNREEKGKTLHLAAKHGWPEVVLALLESATEPDFQDSSSRTALSHAAEKGTDDIVKYLIDWGAFPGSRDNNGQTPLWWAAINGHVAIIQLLLRSGKVDPNAKNTNGLTPLSWAASKGNEAIVKLLLGTSKFDPDIKGRSGETPLWWAAKNGYEAVVRLLLEIGKVDPDVKDNKG
ncbi:hypothetical protein F4819DRAFT_21440 [Hypoxylon fuscum]|nr:hypothetical protein F4819DRAFT_21440 [Hypoxylon fuscum]